MAGLDPGRSAAVHSQVHHHPQERAGLSGVHALTQLTFLTGSTNYFSFGAAWAAGDIALIGAATINCTNGLYKVAADGSGTISLLNIIQPGDPVVYVGGVLGSPGLQLRVLLTATNTILVYWPSPSTGFRLEQNTNLAAANWTTPAETVNDDGTTRFVVVSSPISGRFFRLAKP